MNEAKGYEKPEATEDDPLMRSGVFVHKGQVVIRFNKPTDGIQLSPDEARMMALSLRQCANAIERNPGL